MSSAAPRVLVISLAPVGPEMAGNAIRAYELTRVLGSHVDVRLASPPPQGDGPADVNLVHYDPLRPWKLRAEIERADIVLAQPQRPLVAGWLRKSRARLIFDLYDPEPLEIMEVLADRRRLRGLVHTFTLDRILDALHSGQHFICASGKQRDLWLGAMLGSRLLSPSVYDRDPSMLSVIDEVPFGLPTSPPRADGPGPREHFAPLLGPDDELVLWNGGIWGWLDAPVAVEAIAILARQRPRVRLVFMGTGSAAPARRASHQARQLAGELGLLDRHVFFNPGWVPYSDRAAWLGQADCAISTHVEHLETRFAFRTRLLDCMWASLPAVCTRGDELAGRVERADLGEVVPQRDAEAVAAALARVLERGRESYADAFARARADLSWQRVSAPLVKFVTEANARPELGAGRRRPPARVVRAAGLRAAQVATAVLGIDVWPRA